jgi:hypothetical protein
MAIIYRKNPFVQTQEQALNILEAMDDFVNNPEPGKTPPDMDNELRYIWNNGDWLEWDWSDETEAEESTRLAEEEKEQRLKDDLEYFKDVKIRPWRNQNLFEWIDDTFAKPLKYKLSSQQEVERAELHAELLDWPELFTEYKTDEEIDDLKPDPPSWIS